MALLKVDDIHVYYGSIHAVKEFPLLLRRGKLLL